MTGRERVPSSQTLSRAGDYTNTSAQEEITAMAAQAHASDFTCFSHACTTGQHATGPDSGKSRGPRMISTWLTGMIR